MTGRSPGGRESVASAAWPSLLALALAAPCVYVLSEWLFFATKPSFLDTLPLGRQLLLLLRVAAWLTVPFALAAAAAWAVARWSGPGRLRHAALAAARLLPAVAVAALVLLLLDNFLYTVSGWGTPRLEGPARWLGTAVYLGLLALVAPRVRRWEATLAGRPRLRRAILLLAGLLLARVVADALRSARPPGRSAGRAGRSAPRWNVVLFGGDGISADHLASFGGARSTTPFLDRLAAESLLALNVLPNADATGSSLTSILTGALPSTTRVIYPPDIARGPWVHRHLPGLLKRLGYSTAQFSLRWYADALDLNLRDSFDEANGRTAAPQGRLAVTRHLDADGVYFLEVVVERLLERVVPPAVDREGRDAHREVLGQKLRSDIPDARRTEALHRFVTTARRPFFAHVHFMGTHGPQFHPALRQFSRGRTQRRDWKLNFYDDALLEFDWRLEELVRHLTEIGQLERTLLVVYSDHGMKWDMNARVPLVVRAPHGLLAGRVERRPAQNLDIAPTVLDLLGMPVPDWMQGRSLLDPAREACPEIFAFGHAKRWSSGGRKWFARAAPPFFSLASAALTVGRRTFILHVRDGTVSRRRADLAGDRGAPCPALEARPAAERLVAHLAENGYDVSSLRDRLTLPGETVRPARSGAGPNSP